jgi:molybdate transport system substrate-binding protein
MRRGSHRLGSWLRLVVGSCLVLVASLGCSREPGLVVAAAASLRDVLMPSPSAASLGETRLVFDASSTLVRQLASGAAFDVVITADRETLDRVREHLDPASVTRILDNVLVLAVRGAAATRPASPRDLVDLPGRIAVAGEAVPAGKYARRCLERQGLLAALSPRLVNADHVRAALTLVASGSVDFAFVYATDVRAAGGDVAIAWQASDAADRVSYWAAATRAGRREAACSFLDWLRGDEFQSRARAQAFRPAGG